MFLCRRKSFQALRIAERTSAIRSSGLSQLALVILMAALAAALLVLFAFASGGRKTVAGRSAAAFREALRKGEPVGASAHGHGALSPGAEGTPMHAGHGGSKVAKPQEAHAKNHAMAAHDMSGHDMSASSASGGDHGTLGMSMQAMPPAGHAGMQHGTSATAPAGSPPARHAGMQHGMSATPPTGTSPGGISAGTPGVAFPQSKAAEVSPGQPARTLRPDPLDQPAETSVVDATRSLEMAREMGGMAGMEHGATSYRQLDAGRESAAAVPQGESVPPESSVTPKTGAPAPHHHGMQHGSPQPSPTPVPRPKPPSTERKPSTPESAPTHPPHHHSGGSGDGAGESGGPR